MATRCGKSLLLTSWALMVWAGADFGLATPRAQSSTRPASSGQASAQALSSSAAFPQAAPTPKALVDRYCVSCHSERLKTGGLALEGLDLNNIPAHSETWEKVVRKVRAGMMPPSKRPRPDKASTEAFVTYLEAALDKDAVADVNPGRTEPFHRLNRTEVQNAVRDLLGVEVNLTDSLPPDAASYGFDNIGGVLKMSPTLMERYLEMAQKVSRLAVGTPPPVPAFEYFRVSDDLQQETQLSGLPDGTRGGAAVEYFFPMDGEYQISPRLYTNRNEIPAYSTDQQLEVSIDGAQAQVFVLPAAEAGSQPQDPEAGLGGRQNLDAKWNVRVPVKAGKHVVVATFLNRNIGLDDSSLREPFIKPFRQSNGGSAALKSIEISGPYGRSTAGATPGRERIFVCHPTRSTEEAACAKTIFSSLARRAYRRPVTDEDVQPLLSFYEARRAQDGFEAGIEAGLKRLLVSPQFLFRIEQDERGVAANAVYRLSDLELASRLSFFLWSSIPDDELLTLATRGRLKDPKVLEQQVRRMVADPKAREFVKNFAGQWLYLRKVPFTAPDTLTFSNYDDSLRQAMRQETELFVDSIVRGDRPVTELLSAKYTFVNERLARHYGIPNVHGPDFQRIDFPADSSRGGLLGQASILTVTSYPNRTSPVVRGAWLLENLLGVPPPPPPPNVPGLKDETPGTKPQTLRERMEEHHRNPVCASCHSIMEPLGLALEHFDAVGKWRDVAEGFSAIDATGNLPDGTPFDGSSGLTRALLGKSDRFAATVTEKLLIYALGRGLESYDAPVVRAIVRSGARTNYRFVSDLVLGVVQSVPFQMRKADSEGTLSAAAR
jgi:mono/diheme cytochrome c family protein